MSASAWGDPRRVIVDRIDGLGGLLAGTANVIMQLSRPAVGYGVVESKVESGQVTKHPLKRARTTFTYLAVALLGRPDERAAYRHALDGPHSRVRSGPDSPVRYNAFDPELQLWVAACLYWGAVDVAQKFRGPMDDDTAESFYRGAATLGTTLQVRPEMWPADRDAFARYWSSSLEQVNIDSRVRTYLYDLAALRFMPAPIRMLQSRQSLFFTTGFLPPEFREAMRLEWSAADQARFDQVIKALALLSRVLPGPVRRFPINWYLWDFRMRRRLGLRLV